MSTQGHGSQLNSSISEPRNPGNYSPELHAEFGVEEKFMMNRMLLVWYLVLLISLTVGCSGVPVNDSTVVHTISPKDVALGRLMLEPEKLHSTINIPFS